MIEINLLPWREEWRETQRKNFFVMVGFAVLLGVVVGVLGTMIMGGRVEAQESRNNMLKGDIQVLDQDIKEIEGLQEQSDALLSRKRIIENLQANRTIPTHIFNELAKGVPEGVYLNTFTQKGNNVNINGYAQSNARISSFMRSINDSVIFTDPKLVVSRSIELDKRLLFQFDLTIKVVSSVKDKEQG